MKINFLVNHVDGGWEPTDKRLGGTEESVVRWADGLTSLGNTVTVYRNGNSLATKYGDVKYIDRNMYKGGGDICINVKSSEVLPKEPTLYFTNETDAAQKDLSKYLGVIWPSQWARESISVNNANIFVVPHGYDETRIFPGKKINKQCLYASSPDRGLNNLLKAWLEVYDQHPDAILKVTYGAPEYDIPGVEFLGEVDEETMNQLYRESDIWCHPATEGELFCITGVKAQVAGCVPVILPTMALSETVRHGYVSDENSYAETLLRALNDYEGREKVRERLAKEEFVNWEVSTKLLLGIIESQIG